MKINKKRGKIALPSLFVCCRSAVNRYYVEITDPVLQFIVLQELDCCEVPAFTAVAVVDRTRRIVFAPVQISPHDGTYGISTQQILTAQAVRYGYFQYLLAVNGVYCVAGGADTDAGSLE